MSITPISNDVPFGQDESSFYDIFRFWYYPFCVILLLIRDDEQKQPPEVFYKKGLLKTFAKFTGKHLCQSLFFNKVAGLRSATLLKMRLWYRCFPVNFAKFWRTPFLQNTSGRLLPDEQILRSYLVMKINRRVTRNAKFTWNGITLKRNDSKMT